jgi:glycoprotein 2-beta-D-xylosyltransferase
MMSAMSIHISEENIDNTDFSSSLECIETISNALLITRYEYANLYHTLTDFYNTYQAIRMYFPTVDPLSNDLASIRIIFIDGHSKGAMDAWWPVLFSPPSYLSSLSSKVCISNAVFVSPGYGSALAPRLFGQTCDLCFKDPLLMDFVAFARAQWKMDVKREMTLSVKDVNNEDVDLSDPNLKLVSFIDRRPYLAHPRIKMGSIERALLNSNELFSSVNSSMEQLSTSTSSAIKFVVFDFTKLSADEQLAVIAKTKILVGIHGAALSYILFMDPTSTLLEIVPGGYGKKTLFT